MKWWGNNERLNEVGLPDHGRVTSRFWESRLEEMDKNTTCTWQPNTRSPELYLKTLTASVQFRSVPYLYSEEGE